MFSHPRHECRGNWDSDYAKPATGGLRQTTGTSTVANHASLDRRSPPAVGLVLRSPGVPRHLCRGAQDVTNDEASGKAPLDRTGLHVTSSGATPLHLELPSERRRSFLSSRVRLRVEGAGKSSINSRLQAKCPLCGQRSIPTRTGGRRLRPAGYPLRPPVVSIAPGGVAIVPSGVSIAPSGPSLGATGASRKSSNHPSRLSGPSLDASGASRKPSNHPSRRSGPSLDASGASRKPSNHPSRRSGPSLDASGASRKPRKPPFEAERCTLCG